MQSMIWATDTTGLNLMLTPAGIGECFRTLDDAMKGAIRTTPLIKSAGYHEAVWDAKDNSNRLVPSGVYIYRLMVNGNAIDTRKMIMIK